jgi:hypothetical protein
MLPKKEESKPLLSPLPFAVVALLLAVLMGGIVRGQEARTSAKVSTQSQRVGTSDISVELRETSNLSIFAVRGLPNVDRLRTLDDEQLSKLFTVRVQPMKGDVVLPSLLGTFSVVDGELLFQSRFPLSESVRYQVELSSQLDDPTRILPTLLFSPHPKPKLPAASVLAVYPSSDVLPENLLKFYVHFTAPMSRGEAYQRIHLMQGSREVKSPFLELGEELWDIEQTRFTLFVHPGLVKRGVKPREDSGPPMSSGNEYSLQIDSSWQSADRQPLASTYVKKFRVVDADDQQPSPTMWKIGTPKANTTEPVTLTFDEPLDHAMLNRVLVVRGPSGYRIEGDTTVEQHETRWSFKPAIPWESDDYRVEIATNLEDLSGNSLARPFETKIVDETDQNDQAQIAKQIAVEFFVQ